MFGRSTEAEKVACMAVDILKGSGMKLTAIERSAYLISAIKLQERIDKDLIEVSGENPREDKKALILLARCSISLLVAMAECTMLDITGIDGEGE